MTLSKLRSAIYSRVGFAALLTTFWLSGCGSDATEPSAASANDVMPAPGAQSSTATSAKLWEGEPAGYESQGDPAKDDAAFLISLGRVLAAIGRAGHYDKEEGMSNPFTSEVLAEYSAIDPVVSGKSSANLSLQPLLSEVASPASFVTIMDGSSSKRMERNAIQVQLTTLKGRIDAIVTERFPSIKSSALAMSALHREAGELLKTGLSADGQVIDVTQYRDAKELMAAALRLRVNKVSVCDRSREAIDQLKDRGPLGALLDRLIIVSEQGTLNSNAGEVFEAAQMLEQLGASLPDDDSDICS
ncbi:MAG: hypothetical protein AB8B86_14830 [Pseudomonadales bacterium]